MLYYNRDETKIGFLEIPTEISLCISILGCNIGCKDCHSKHNWIIDNNSLPLTIETLCEYLLLYKDKATCITFMGGEWEINYLITLLSFCKEANFKTALYTGLSSLEDIDNRLFKMLDYIKIGSYTKEKGGLDSKTTNQKLFYRGKDITYKFKQS